MIKVHHLQKTYKGVTVLNIPQLEIQTGELIGLVGNNGAGKTTLLRLVLDLISATSGEVYIKDENVAKNEDWKSYTAAYLDDGFLIGYLTPEEYFYFTGSLHNRSKADVDDYLQEFTDFFDGSILQSGKYIRDLSKGNQFKVGIAACLMQNPELLLLDEPFSNLDPTSQSRLVQLLKQLQQQKRMTIIVSSHDLNHIADLSTRVLLLEKGNLIKDIHQSEQTLDELERYFSV